MSFYNIKFYFKARFPRFIYYKTKFPERNRKTLKNRFDELDIPRNRYCFGKCRSNDMMAMRRILFFGCAIIANVANRMTGGYS